MTCKSCFVVQAPQLGKGPHRVYIARKGDNPVGAVMEATAPDGYSGAIQLLVGSDFSGTVLGTRVTEHHETPGLGDKIETRLSDWILHFAGKMIHGEDDPAFAVKKMAASLTSSRAPRLPRARWSTPSSAPGCMPKRCPRRSIIFPPVRSDHEPG